MHYMPLLLAAPQSGGEAAQANPLLAFAPIILMFVVFYFLLIRPQQKRQKQHENMVNNIKKGDRVVTSGGLIGTVVGTKENQVVIKVGDDEVKLEILKSSVSQLLKV